MQAPYGVGNHGGEGGYEYSNTDNMAAFSVKSVRMAFIRKVYGILSVQLIITTGFILIFALSEGSQKFAKGNPWMVWMSFIMSIGSLIALSCCGEIRRKFPHNFICLGIFTLAQSLMLGIVSAFYKTHIVLMAIGITALICISLTIFAFQTKIDFTVYSGAAFICCLVLMVMGFVLMFTRLSWLNVLYSGLGALLFSFFLLIDTQMIVGGTRAVVISPEEYILAVITLYMDIVQIFIHILNLLNSTN